VHIEYSAVAKVTLCDVMYVYCNWRGRN